MKISKKVEMYLKIRGCKIEEFIHKREDDDGEMYYTNQKVDPVTMCMLCIKIDGTDFAWISIVGGK